MDKKIFYAIIRKYENTRYYSTFKSALKAYKYYCKKDYHSPTLEKIGLDDGDNYYYNDSKKDFVAYSNDY